MIVMNIRGADYTDKVLRTLGYRITRNVVVSATRAGTNVIRDLARQLAPKRTRLLSRRLGTSVKVNRVSGTAIGTVKGRRTKRQRSNKEKHTNRYLHLVVAGTKPHTIDGPVSLNGKLYSKIEHPGAKAKPFMDQAARLGFRPSLAAFETKLEERTIKEVNKLRAAQPSVKP